MTNVWVIRGGRANSLVDVFIDAGVTGMGYSTVPDASGLDRDEIETMLRDEGTSATPGWHAEMLVDFAQRIAPGDVIVMPDTPRGDVVIGEVTGPYTFLPDLPAERYRHRLPVTWLGRNRHADMPPGREDLYQQLPALLELQDVDDLVAHAQRVRLGEVGKPATQRSSVAPRTPRAAPAPRRVVASGGDERMCSECFQKLRPSAFAGADSVRCRSCESH